MIYSSGGLWSLGASGKALGELAQQAGFLIFSSGPRFSDLAPPWGRGRRKTLFILCSWPCGKDIFAITLGSERRYTFVKHT